MAVNRQFVLGWLWSIGLVCLALPFFWWPRPFSMKMLLHVAVFMGVLGYVVNAGEEGGAFDGKRSAVRGYAGVLAFSAVIFGATFFYRWFIL